jgi:hypothetical protein
MRAIVVAEEAVAFASASIPSQRSFAAWACRVGLSSPPGWASSPAT